MERLLDQADALLLAAGEDGQPDLPDFDIPEDLVHLTTPDPTKLELKESPSKGRGFFARADTPAGTILLVAKPVSMALDDEILGLEEGEEEEEEDDGPQMTGDTGDAAPTKNPIIDDADGFNGIDNPEDDEEEYALDMEESENPEEPLGSTVNELLVLDVLEKILEDPLLWLERLCNLYPREAHDIAASPVWISKDDHTFSQFEGLIKKIETVPALAGKSKEISQRLPLIVRYNVLSIETCPELLSFPGPNGHHPLSGVGLYHWPSFFNHDARPNVARYTVGDVMWLVTNQNVSEGEELCISYLEHDVLCENATRRNYMLTLDFQEEEDAGGQATAGGGAGSNDDNDADDDGPTIPVVDRDVQNEIMAMADPFAQLDAIEKLMAQASGEALPEGERGEGGEDGMDAQPAAGATWFECDLQNLRILKAITLDGMGLSKEAISVWEECVHWTESKMPPNDETSIVMRVQAALCAMHLKEEARATQHAAVALERHNLMFGGGVRRFRRRYRQDFRLNLRPTMANPTSVQTSLEDLLWPYEEGK